MAMASNPFLDFMKFFMANPAPQAAAATVAPQAVQAVAPQVVPPAVGVGADLSLPGAGAAPAQNTGGFFSNLFHPSQAPYNPAALGGADTTTNFLPHPGAATAPVNPNMSWVDRFRPALEFANTVGTAMSAAGGNQVGTAIGQYTAGEFANQDAKKAISAGMQTAQPQVQPGYQSPTQAVAPVVQPQPSAPASRPGDAFMRPATTAPSALAQTKIGASPANPTNPPIGGAGSPLGGTGFFDSMNFDPSWFMKGLQGGQDQAALAIRQAQEGRQAAVFNPDLERAAQQLAYDQANVNYSKDVLPQTEFKPFGNAYFENTQPGLILDPNTKHYVRDGSPSSVQVATKQSDPFTLSAGAERWGYDANGNPVKIAAAPRVEPQDKWTYDSKRGVQINQRTGEVRVPDGLSDLTGGTAGSGKPSASTVLRNRAAMKDFQKLEDEHSKISGEISLGTVKGDPTIATDRLNSIKNKLEGYKWRFDHIDPVTGELPPVVSIPLKDTRRPAGKVGSEPVSAKLNPQAESDFDRIPEENWGEFEQHLQADPGVVDRDKSLANFRKYRMEKLAGK